VSLNVPSSTSRDSIQTLHDCSGGTDANNGTQCIAKALVIPSARISGTLKLAQRAHCTAPPSSKI